ncbi:MAG: Bifunctional hemolysin/adenylate cyclase precursor [Actinomycetota bacterium]|jgi:hypothetical protein
MKTPKFRPLVACSILMITFGFPGVPDTAAFGSSATVSTITGPTGSDSFGSTGAATNVVVLANGNVVIADPDFDSGVSDVGAVHVYDGTTFDRLSTITGSTVNDRVGAGWSSTGVPGIVTLQGSSNFLIVSTGWDRIVSGSPRTDNGAITWVNGSTGLPSNTTQNASKTYEVSVDNSLVGGSFNGERVGSGGVVSLINGNYVVSTPETNLTVDNAGYVTWCSGSSPCTGVINTSNSLHGSTSLDEVGSGGVTALNNGNYVVSSPKWNGTVADVGAVTWCNGTTGCTGPVSASNSLVGSTASDSVSSTGVTALTNGNYVVRSPLWNGAAADVGAITWCNGTTGCTGVAVSSTNSLVGTTASDQVGSSGVTALTNGNYVVVSTNWDNGATADVGAITWCSGAAGCIGAVSTTNSFHGTTASDQVGSSGVTALTNGNYVVVSPLLDGVASDTGAVTWCDGATSGTRCVGEFPANRTLIGGTISDQVGSSGVTALTNGNYVVRSPLWNGAAADVGAVTWCNGTTGCTGVAVSSTNSLVGTTASDQVGSSGVTALTNGNYVVSSRLWNGATADVGAVTWCNGTTGCTGAVSTTNSLHGSTSFDQVGNSGVIDLDNGHYVARSSSWDNGATADVGAVTWCNGTTGCTGAVSTANSLHGSTLSDSVGANTATHITSGSQEDNLALRTPLWNNPSPALTDVGAITLFNTSTAGPRTTGPITSSNSVLGTVASQRLGNTQVPLFDSVNERIYVYNDNDGNIVTVISFVRVAAATSPSGGASAATIATTTVPPPTSTIATRPLRSSVTVAEFADRSARLTTELRRQARVALARHPEAKTVVCRGFVKTEQLNNERLVTLAQNRANRVCAYLRTLKPSLQTTVVRGAATDGRRRVVLTFRN